ncbi:type I restriction enzyme, S subunit [Bryocella elongata]|uniref:Type I restriction enzyme, S subunit n=1 Tax=Bryocella elongata TaxID=863522 RepID=A0A1H6AEV7_9BACT|nr:restriction endonuclease subunit S [Bryocella elongata]SEG46704.1 type I restriction enzyme, S subunit [Bryocella elongata]
MPESWKKMEIGEVGRLVTGRTPPTENPEYFGNDFPFITPGDMHQGKYVRSTTRSLSEKGAALLSRIKVPAGSVCVSCIGWQMGEVVMTETDSFTNQQINTVVPHDEVNASFLYYSLLPRKQQLLSLGSAAGVRTPILNKTAFSKLTLRMPEPPMQRRIGALLSAYDDLIENNQRRIRILENMVRSVYREWFVHFRFPCHENHPRVPSHLGQVPMGWKPGTIDNIAAFLSRGISPKYDDDGESLVINQKCIRDQRLSLGPARRQSKMIPKTRILSVGDVLINSTGVGTLGRVAQVVDKIGPVTVDSHVTIVRPTPGTDQHYFGCALLDRETEFERLGVGATGQTELSRRAIGQVEMIIPPLEIQTAFGGVVGPLRKAVVSYLNQNENLRVTRDLLLPRLLSGQIKLEAN